jgi:hypothetical protein
MSPVPAGRLSTDELRQHLAMLQRHLDILRRLNAPANVIESVQQALEDARRQLEPSSRTPIHG